MAKRLGLIQSRGLGDLVIALPIAHHYHREGWEVCWPICEPFYKSMQPVAPWVKWIPIPDDPQGLFFYDVPMQRLKNLQVNEVICLYQSLTGHRFHEEKYFQYTKFDQYKYIKAEVPFLNKWKLAECLTRNSDREQALYNKLVTNPNYVVYHRKGSDFEVNVDLSIIPKDWQIIEITEETDCIFDWLTIMERAQSLILVDSVFANLVDQLNIGDDRYFIQRSHIGLTPVLGQHWTWIET